jgi:hypothetical protein
MNITSSVEEPWVNEIQFGNVGAVLFIVAYIGFYGLGIIFVFGQQLKEIQRQRFELPAYFLKTLWDVPNKNKLYGLYCIKRILFSMKGFFFLEELSDVDRLKRIFSGYFADHESYATINNDQLQAMVERRAYTCARKYREKLRRLHLSHTDYYLDSVQRISNSESDVQEQISKSMTLTHTTVMETDMNDSNREDRNYHLLSVSVV